MDHHKEGRSGWDDQGIEDAHESGGLAQVTIVLNVSELFEQNQIIASASLLPVIGRPVVKRSLCHSCSVPGLLSSVTAERTMYYTLIPLGVVRHSLEYRLGVLSIDYGGYPQLDPARAERQ